MTGNINKIIKADLFRYGGRTSILKGFASEGFRYMYFFRKASRYPKFSPLGLFYRCIVRHLGYKFGYQIPVNTSIGAGFYIGHFGTVVINGNAKIGRNCNIAHSTTIGMSNRGNRKGVPTIGDKVWIGTGAVIVGNVNIGSNVLIAPNSYVNIDVPADSLVIGNPARIIPRVDATEGYVNFIIDERIAV